MFFLYLLPNIYWQLIIKSTGQPILRYTLLHTSYFSTNRVQVKPGKTLRKQEDISKHYVTKLPIVATKPSEYKPIPYTFRVEAPPVPVKITNLMARSPPLYMLLDHTIAVIWALYSSKEYNSSLGKYFNFFTHSPFYFKKPNLL